MFIKIDFKMQNKAQWKTKKGVHSMALDNKYHKRAGKKWNWWLMSLIRKGNNIEAHRYDGML